MSPNHHRSIMFAWLVWGVAATFYCYEYLLRILPSVMTDHLRNLFMINGFSFGNLSAAYYYTYVPMQLPAGILIDRSSTRNVLSIACMACAIGMYAFSSYNFYLAYFGRLFIGLGSAFAFLGVMKLAAVWFPPSYFSFITGLTTSLGMLGAMAGNLSLVHLIDGLGASRLITSTILFGILLTLLIYGIIEDNYTKQSTTAFEPLSLTQYRAEVFRLLNDPQLWLLGIIGSGLFLSLTAFAEMWGILYLVKYYALSQQSAASHNALVFLGWAIGSPSMGYLANHCHANRLPRLIAVNALLAAISFSLILYGSFLIKPYLKILLFLFGIFSSSQIILFTIVRNRYGSNLCGIAFAVTNLLVMLGGGLSQPMIGYLLDAFSEPSTIDSFIHFSSSSFVYALTVLPVACIVSALLSYYIKPVY